MANASPQTSKREAALNDWCATRGLMRLPDSAYGEHVGYRMARVKGLKRPVRVLVQIVNR